MNSLSSVKKIMLSLTILVLCGLIFLVGQLGLADIYAHKSYRTLKTWQLAPYVMEDAKWDKIKNNLQHALVYDPGNPELMMATGLAYEGRYAEKAVQLPEAKADRGEALAYYRQSVALRPGWPYGWIDLALVKYRLGELDQEFYDALNTADELGPWEPGVQRVIIDIGLHGWNHIDDATHTLVLNTIKKAVIHSDKKHVDTILGILKKYRVLYYACSVKDDSYLRNRCN